MNMFSGGPGMFGAPSAQRGYQITPEEEEDLLSSLGRAGLSSLAYIGESIDKPMAALRGLLAGRPEEIANIIPFSDALGITSSDGMFGGTALQVTDDEDTVYGRDLLEAWGIADENNDGLGGSDWDNIDYGDAAADVAGFAVDMLGVPMAGPVKALSKAGQISKMAGISDDAIKLAKLDGLGATKFRVTNTLDDAVNRVADFAGNDSTRDGLMQKLYHAGDKKYGMAPSQVDELMGQQLGNTMRFGGVNLPKRVDEAVATGVDELGQSLGRTGLGRLAKQAFAPSVAGTQEVVGQEWIGPLHRIRQQAGEETARTEMAKFAATVHRHSDTLKRLGDGDVVSGTQRAVEIKDVDRVLNWPGLIDGDAEKILEVRSVSDYTSGLARRAKAEGVDFAPLEDKYGDHLARGELGRQQNILEGQAKQFNAVDASTEQGRQEFLKNYPNVTSDLREIAIETAHDGPEEIAALTALKLQPELDDLHGQLMGMTSKASRTGIPAMQLERAQMAAMEKAALKEAGRPARELASLEKQRERLVARMMGLEPEDQLAQPMTGAQRAGEEVIEELTPLDPRLDFGNQGRPVQELIEDVYERQDRGKNFFDQEEVLAEMGYMRSEETGEFFKPRPDVDVPPPDLGKFVSKFDDVRARLDQATRQVDQARAAPFDELAGTEAAAAQARMEELDKLINGRVEEAGGLKREIKSVEAKPEAVAQYYSGLKPEVRLEGVFGDPVGMAKRNAEATEDVIANAATTTDTMADYLSGGKVAELSLSPDAGIMRKIKDALGFMPKEPPTNDVTIGEVLKGLGFATEKRGPLVTADSAADVIRRKMEPKALQELDEFAGTLDDLIGPRTEQGIVDFARDQNDTILNATLPTPVVDTLAQLKKALSGPDPTSMITDGAVQYNRLWKGLQTNPWINFHMRNLGSGQAREVLAGNNPGKHFDLVRRLESGGEVSLSEATQFPGVRELMDAQNIPDENAADALRQWLYTNMPTEGQGMSLEDMGHRFSGLHDSAGTGADLGFLGGLDGTNPIGFKAAAQELKPLVPGSYGRAARAESPDWYKPAAIRGVSGRDRTQQVMSAAGEKLGEGVEGLNRAPSFLDQVDRGFDPRQAARNVNESQIDYSTRAFTPFENEIRRLGIMPFYSFSSRNIPYVAKELLNNPTGRTGTMFKGLTRLRSDDEFLPEHIAQSLAIPLGSSEDGEPRYLTGLGLMEEDLLGAVDTGNPLKAIGYEAMGRLSPIIKAPIEYVLGKSLFQSGYQGPRDVEDMDPQLGRLMSNLIGFGTGEDQRVAVDTRSIEPLLQLIPGIRAISNARQVTDKRKYDNAGLPLLMNQLTGSRIADVSTSAQDASLMDMIANEYKDMGGRDFSNYYIPDAIQEDMTPEELNSLKLLRALQSIRDRRKRERMKAMGY